MLPYPRQSISKRHHRFDSELTDICLAESKFFHQWRWLERCMLLRRRRRQKFHTQTKLCQQNIPHSIVLLNSQATACVKHALTSFGSLFLRRDWLPTRTFGFNAEGKTQRPDSTCTGFSVRRHKLSCSFVNFLSKALETQSTRIHLPMQKRRREMWQRKFRKICLDTFSIIWRCNGRGYRARENRKSHR